MKTKQADKLRPGDAVVLETLVNYGGSRGIDVGKTRAKVIALEPREDGCGFDIAAKPTTGGATLIIRQFALPSDRIEVG